MQIKKPPPLTLEERLLQLRTMEKVLAVCEQVGSKIGCRKLEPAVQAKTAAITDGKEFKGAS